MDGPTAEPHFYEADGEHLRLGTGSDDQPDLLRLPTDDLGRDVAAIPDPRNDENRVISQIQLALAQRHNEAVDETSDFAQARDEVRARYHRAIVEDYLPRLCGEDIIGRALQFGPSLLPPPYGQFIPIEFSGAAFRFGHTQVRPRYQIQAGDATSVPIFADDEDPDDLRGGRRLSAEHRITDPTFWFAADAQQKSRRLDTKLAPSLFTMFGKADPAKLPFPNAAIARNLAARNLERGVVLGLPAGEDVHDALVARGLISPLADDVKAQIQRSFWGDELAADPRTEGKTPLWAWVLAEADIAGSGQHLGPVGATIVSHTIVGLLYADPRSRIATAGWEPGGGGSVLHLITG